MTIALVTLVVAQEAAGATLASRKLPTRSIEAGDVTVELTPTRVDDEGAVVEIVLDTHAVELDMNLRRGASLDVDGVKWTTVSYQGDGPSGHHREGRLRFRAEGPLDGELLLRIRGLPEPARAVWRV